MSQFPAQGQWPGPQQPPPQPGWQQPPRPGPQGWNQGWVGPGQHQWQQHQNWQQQPPQFPGQQFGGQQFRGQQFPPPPRKSNTAMVVAVIAVGLALVAGIVTWAQRDVTVADTTPFVSPSLPVSPPISTDPPTTDPPITDPPTTDPPTTDPPTTPPPPDQSTGPGALPQRNWDKLPGPTAQSQDWVTVQANKLYGQNLPAMNCPDVPDGFSSIPQFQEFAGATLKCQHQGWATAFSAIGVDLPMPTVTFIDGAVQSPCGKAGEQVSFYCGTWDGSSYAIYVHNNLSEQSNSWWRLRASETLAHEFGHHVQMLSGIMRAASNITQTDGMDNFERSRRIELQTSCWAMSILVHTPAMKFNAKDHQTMVEWSQRDQDEYHGTKESNQYWWQRGLYMTAVEGCNTWTVGPDRVT